LIFSLLVIMGSPFNDLSQSTSPVIRAHTQPASVELAPSSDDGGPIRLPELQFALRIEPVCASGAEPRSLSISIADTRLHFTASDLADAPLVEATLTLPRTQLGPVRVDGFCRSGDENSPPTFLLEDVYTARLSLLCELGAQQTIVYTTLPLDVDLRCRRAETEASSPDQEPSSLELSESF